MNARFTKRAGMLAATVVAMSVAGVMMALVPSVAQEPPAPIHVEELTPRATFTDDLDLVFKLRLEHQGPRPSSSTFQGSAGS
ncbi:MAG: hypothetical protein ACRD29_07705 [Acidimicrobiales bacterium]